MTTPLSCPEPENYAAVAKQMHETALEAEARIFELEHLLRFAVNRPTLIQTTTVAITGLGANIDNLIGPGQTTSTRTFDNTALLSEKGVDEFDIFAELGEGLYEVGMFANVIASGAVDDNSIRSFRIVQQRPDPNLGVVTVQDSGYTMFESNTGVGSDCCIVSHFRMRTSDRLAFIFFHQNTSSTMNVSSGNIFWLHKLSDSSIIRTL